MRVFRMWTTASLSERKRTCFLTHECPQRWAAKTNVPQGASCPEHEVIRKTKIQGPPNKKHQVIGNRQAGRRRGALTALDATDHPLRAETVGDEVWKPLFNMECANPRQVDLNGRMLNPISQEGSKQAQCPFVRRTGRT